MNPTELIHSLHTNKIIFAVLILFVSIYGPRLHPRLPRQVRSLFHNPIFRAIILFTIVFMAQRDIKLSIMVAVGFMVLMYLVQMSQMFEMFESEIEKNKEHFAIYGRPLADCQNYSESSTPFYPMQ
jgi:predicted membrane protein